MIPAETPFKVLKYLMKLSDEKVLPKNYENETLMLHFVERNYLTSPKNSPNKFFKTKDFEDILAEEIFPAFQKYDSFIKSCQIDKLGNHCTIKELEALIEIKKTKEKILCSEFSFQTILTQYFGSSKHRKVDSILSDVIKIILGIDYFPEESKDQQFISILYPKSETRFIIICENKNRLIVPRHDFIEFWYAGGKNTKQLRFVPKPKHPIFYLFDWDYDGLNIYIDIKKKYFPTLNAFIPDDFESLMEKQDEVKEHHSKWKNDNCLQYLNYFERTIVMTLILTDSIIEEQKIKLTNTNLLFNSIT
jgi:hypothetical protein